MLRGCELFGEQVSSCSHLEETGDHVNVGPGGSHQHAQCQAGVHILQVLLRGLGSATHTRVSASWRPAQSEHRGKEPYVHLREGEQGVQVDVAVKHIHGEARQELLKVTSARIKVQRDKRHSSYQQVLKQQLEQQQQQQPCASLGYLCSPAVRILASQPLLMAVVKSTTSKCHLLIKKSHSNVD